MWGFYLGLALVLFLSTLIVLVLCNKWLGKWACTKMGWHLEPSVIHFDEVNSEGVCPRCGKRVLRDGQGNWFETTGG